MHLSFLYGPQTGSESKHDILCQSAVGLIQNSCRGSSSVMRCGSAATICRRNGTFQIRSESSRTEKAHQVRSASGVLVVLFIIHVVVHREFITEGRLVKAELYIWCKQSELWLHSMQWHHSNCTCHLCWLPQPTVSLHIPNLAVLALHDFFHFLQMKFRLTGCCSGTV